MLMQQRLREVLRYNRSTGVFTRLRNQYRTDLVGKPAGCLRKDGYVDIVIDGTSYLAHSLAWLYVTGEWRREIDHKNTRRADNRWRNLRPATRSLNRANSRIAKNNTSGIKGVRRYRSGKFQARIGQIHLGYFPTAELAQSAYVAAAKKHFGEFARLA